MLSVDPTDPTPLYAQLDRGIRAAIAQGDSPSATACRPCASSPSISRSTPTPSPRCTPSSNAPACSPRSAGIGTFVLATPPTPPTPAQPRVAIANASCGHSSTGFSPTRRRSASRSHEIVEYLQTLEASRHHQGEDLTWPRKRPVAARPKQQTPADQRAIQHRRALVLLLSSAPASP